MPLTKISGSAIQTGAITVDSLHPSVQPVKIANVQVANSTWGLLDDTAVDTTGGYVIINGSGFTSNSSVLIGTATASAVSFVSSSQLRVQVPGQTAGTYPIYVVNSDGTTAIRVNALNYSGFPNWITSATLPRQGDSVLFSIQLSADGATSYALQAGSSLPPNTSLASNGLLTGTVGGLSIDTTYSFVVEATDAENQNTPRTFSVTVTLGEEYFKTVTLLIDGNGSNNASSNTFIDSSNSNFTITKYGNARQGSFSPFSRPDGQWSTFFDGSTSLFYFDNTTLETSLGPGPFTIEAWINCENLGSGGSTIVSTYHWSMGNNFGFWLDVFSDKLRLAASNGTWNTFPTVLDANTTFIDGQWYHIAVTRDSNNLIRAFKNGVLINSVTSNTSLSNSGGGLQPAYFTIGVKGPGDGNYSNRFRGFISNLRCANVCFYSNTFTPSTTPLTANSGTFLLTCQSNRLKDNSTNNYTPTSTTGTQVTTPHSPFSPTESYSTTVNGGSVYFDGSGDYLSVPANSWNFGSNEFTVELWCYLASVSTSPQLIGSHTSGVSASWLLLLNTSRQLEVYYNNGNMLTASTAMHLNSWNHVALVRQGNTSRVYLNGVQVASGTFGTINSDSAPITIGGDNDGAQNAVTGYISGVRVINGSCLYPNGTSFTVPSLPPTTSGNTVFLCNFTNAAIIDRAAFNNIETVGNTTIRTNVSKYGSGSMFFNGNSGLSFASSPSFNFNTGNYTVEGWLNLTSNTMSNAAVFAFGVTNLGLWFGGSGNGYRLGIYNNGGYTDLTSSGITQNSFLNTWKHFAMVRNNSTLSVYVNGNSVYSTASTNYLPGPTFLEIGYSQSSNYLQGYIDDFRISKGYARYTSNFTPPLEHVLKGS